VVNDGYAKVDPNNYLALLNAVALVGPVAVNVATGGGVGLMNYESGVYSDDCGSKIDHVVVVVGYGTSDEGEDYYLIRNSWGDDWGDGGYIKLARHDDDDQPARCAVDSDPSVGTGCMPYPETQTVCGPCGILFDASFPTGVRLVGGTNADQLGEPVEVLSFQQGSFEQHGEEQQEDAQAARAIFGEADVTLKAVEGAVRPLVAL
jgi:hypothetical protein